MRDEAANQADAVIDGVGIEVAAQLLVAPAVEHLLDRLDLGMEQGNRAHQEYSAALVDGHHASRIGLI